MLNKPIGYDEAQASFDTKYITPGWYAAAILKVGEGQTPNGSQYLEFAFDIIDGEFAQYYAKDFKAQTGTDKKWRGTLRLFTTEKALPMLKGAITSIEESNPGYTWTWDENTVKGKKVGIGVRREQYEATDGQLKFSTKPFMFCSVQKVLAGDMEPPKDKLLNKPTTSAPSYAPPSMTPPGYTSPAPSYPPLTEVGPDDELPF